MPALFGKLWGKYEKYDAICDNCEQPLSKHKQVKAWFNEDWIRICPTAIFQYKKSKVETE
jgi:hypothetical protein